jgi:phosphate acetyltransferase
LEFLASVRARARERAARIVFPEGSDPRTLDAAARLLSEGLVRPILLGNREEVAAGLEARATDPESIPTVDPLSEPVRSDTRAALVELRAHRGLSPEEAWNHAASPLMLGALMVRRGEAAGSVAGAANATGDVIRAALWCVGPAPGIRTVSSSFYMGVGDFRGRGREVLTFTDCAVVPHPDPVQLGEIGFAAATARRNIVGDEPSVAFLSYSTRGSAEGPAIDAVRGALERFRELAPDVPADGEIQVDAALIQSIGDKKAPGSAVAGRANVLVFPDLNAGNIAYKLVQRLGGADAVGPIVQGLAKPCNDLSRGATADDIVNVACITALSASSS